MPSGASVLCALAVLVAAGLLDPPVRALGLPRAAGILWPGAIAAASVVNLRFAPAAPLLDPGGSLVPAALTAFLLWGRGTRPRTLPRLLGSALATGIVLCVVPALGLEAGAGWVGTAGAALGAAVASAAAARGPRESLAVGCAGMALGAALRYAAGVSGLLVAAPSLGGGTAFDAGVLALIGSQVLPRLPALGRRLLRGVPSAQGRRIPDTAR